MVPVPGLEASYPGADRTRHGDVAVIACGAIAQPCKEIVDRRGWPVDVHPLPPLLHNRPELIAGEVERLALRAAPELRTSRRRVRRLRHLRRARRRLRRGSVMRRLAGLHCYDVYAGPERLQTVLRRAARHVRPDRLPRPVVRAHRRRRARSGPLSRPARQLLRQLHPGGLAGAGAGRRDDVAGRAGRRHHRAPAHPRRCRDLRPRAGAGRAPSSTLTEIARSTRGRAMAARPPIGPQPDRARLGLAPGGWLEHTGEVFVAVTASVLSLRDHSPARAGRVELAGGRGVHDQSLSSKWCEHFEPRPKTRRRHPANALFPGPERLSPPTRTRTGPAPPPQIGAGPRRADRCRCVSQKRRG